VLAAVIALGVIVALLVLLVGGLLRSHADILKALHELGASLDDGPTAGRTVSGGTSAGAGRAAPDLLGVAADGAQLTASVSGGHDSLLVFLSTGCRTCQPFWDALRNGATAPDGTQVLVVTRGPDEESPARVADLAGPHVAVVMSTDAWERYEIPGSPHVVYVDGASGTVRGEGAAGSWDQVLGLLVDARRDRSHARSWLDDPVVLPADYRDNADRIDAELAAQGIGAGHQSLFPRSRS
jgi:hypothetical protein